MLEQHQVLLGEPLGTGGFGMVYKGLWQGEPVAVKVLAPNARDDSEVVSRFEREGEVLARTNHPNILRCFGRCDTSEGPGLLLELAQRTLLDLLRLDRIWGWERVAHEFGPLFKALAQLHDLGIVHRDLKPNNILEVGGVLKLADFGIAQVPRQWDEHGPLTATGVQPGTPMYQSPEQVRGQVDLDGRSDLYALGVVMYGALTGEYYLDTGRYRNDFELQLGVLQDPPRPLGKALAIPEALATLCRRLLEKERGRRPHSAREVAAALSGLLGIGSPATLPPPPTTPDGLTVAQVLASLRRDYPRQVRAVLTQGERPGRTAEPETPLPAALQRGLARLGISALHEHQAQGVDAIRRGAHTLLVTGTASGKTLTYLLPILERLAANPEARALLLFPLKALASDQRQALERLCTASGLEVSWGLYDGDTPQDKRRRLEVNPPQLLFANPDVLHATVLRHHHKWARFWRGMSYVVIDEMHVYNGAFGSHVANVLTRLRAVLAQHGAKPQFVLCSATTDAPLAHAHALTGEDFTLIDTDAAPRGERHLVFWEPFGSLLPYSEEWQRDTVEVMVRLLRAGRSAIAFADGRQLAERLAQAVAERLSHAGLARNLVTVYRGGLLPEERQELEAKLRDGEIRGVISTSALEAGVDIGGLDAVILAGLPETITSTWQRVGRAGRRGQPSLVVFIARPNRFDLYHLAHPQTFLARPPEPSALYPGASPILELHVAAGVQERSLEGPASSPPWSPQAVVRATLHPRPQDLFPKPHGVSLRSNEGQIRILHGEHEVGNASWTQALRELYPGALYRHAGRVYRVTTLGGGEAQVEPEFTGNHTRADLSTFVNIRPGGSSTEHRGFQIGHGPLSVRSVTEGYREYTATDRQLGRTSLAPLTHTFETTGAWLELPAPLTEDLDGDWRGDPEEPPPSFAAAHAAEHLLGFAVTLLMGSAPRDVVGVPFPRGPHPHARGVRVFLWDTSSLQLGLAGRLARTPLEVVRKALEVAACPCGTYEGCPRCTVDPACSLFNRSLWKGGGVQVLRSLEAALTG